jgi:hypothetical protein
MLKLIYLLILLHGYSLYSQNTDYPKNIVNTLASTEYMGRGYVGKADLKSACFIRNEFRRQGVQELCEDYFQFFNLNINTFPGKMEVKLKDKTLVPGINYLIDPCSPSVKGKFEVIRVNRFDLRYPETVKRILDETPGKALLIDMTDTIKYTKSEEETIKKVINALQYDPAITNSLTITFSDKKLTWGLSDVQCRKAVITMNSSGLSAGEISEIEVNIKSSYKKNYQTQNVIGMIRGKSNLDSFLVLTAHYDHLGIMGKGTCFPGANDNASGVAMLLYLSQYYANNPPEYSMVFIAFSAEEAGLLGSDHFLQNPPFETEKIKFLINFDLAGTGDEGIKVVNGTVFKNEFEVLTQINDQNKFLSSVQPRGEACISDHCLFYLKKIPCFYIYTLGGISAYHDIFDKPETLPLTEFYDYSSLIISFLNNFSEQIINP